MLTNMHITLFRFNEDTDEYENAGHFSAWVHKTEATAKTENGVRRRDTFDIRFDLKKISNVEPEYLVFFGERRDKYPDLKACLKISRVTRNAFGRSPHWHLQAEA